MELFGRTFTLGNKRFSYLTKNDPQTYLIALLLSKMTPGDLASETAFCRTAFWAICTKSEPSITDQESDALCDAVTCGRIVAKQFSKLNIKAIMTKIASAADAVDDYVLSTL